MRARVRAFLSSLSFVAAFAFLRTASADDAERLVVFAPSRGTAGFLDGLEHAVDAQLGDVHLRLARERAEKEAPVNVRARMEAAKGSHALCLFWIESDQESRQVFLHVLDPRGGRLLVRTFPPESEATAEGISVVVRSSALALAEGGAIGVELPPAKPAAAPPPPPPVPAPPGPPPPPPADEAGRGAGESSRLGISVSYAGVASPSLGYWRSGVEAGLRSRLIGGAFAGVALRVLAPVQIKDPSLTLSLTSFPVEVFVGHEWSWGRFTVAPKLGGLVEYGNRSATASDPRLMPTDDRGSFVFGLAPELEARLSLTRWMAVRLGAGVDLLFNPQAYIVDFPTRRVVLDAEPVRPRAELGLLARAW